jgi:hypothetical protein
VPSAIKTSACNVGKHHHRRLDASFAKQQRLNPMRNDAFSLKEFGIIKDLGRFLTSETKHLSSQQTSLEHISFVLFTSLPDKFIINS